MLDSMLDSMRFALVMIGLCVLMLGIGIGLWLAVLGGLTGGVCCCRRERCFVLIKDYLAEPDWAIIGIFTTRKQAEFFKIYCERKYLDPLRVEEVIFDSLLPLGMEMPSVPEEII